MTFSDLKKQEYPDNLPLELVLSDLMFNGKLDFISVSRAYTNALEKERHHSQCMIAENNTSLCQILSGNYKKKEDRDEMFKRAIHVYNMNKTFVPHIFDAQYGYTEEDEKKWDEFTSQLYGIDL